MNGTLQWHAVRHREFTPFKRASTMQTRAARSVVRELQQQVAGGQRSAFDVTREYLQQLRSVEDALGSFITVDDEYALAQVHNGLRWGDFAATEVK
jgi:hypothetical protein